MYLDNLTHQALAPQPLRLSPWQVLPLFRQSFNPTKVISYDIARIIPKYDQDQRTAKLAANFILRLSIMQNTERFDPS